MITVKQESKLLERIKTLSELEFSALLKEMADHIGKNHWEHIIDECFEIETFADELEEMEDERNYLQHKLEEIDLICESVEDVEEFEDDGFEKLSSAINKIRDEI